MAFLLMLVIGMVSATFGSIVGLGGGIIIVPSLISIAPMLLGQEISAQVAVGTSLAVLILTALTSTLTYAKRRRIDFRSGWLYFASSGPAAMLGAALTGSLDQNVFQLAFGGFMLFMALLLIARDHLKPFDFRWKVRREFTDAAGQTYVYGYSVVPALITGFVVGLTSGLFGIGGGSLFVPIMVLLFGYPPHIAAATSMFVILLSAILGSVTHVIFGEVDWVSFAALAPGALIGGWLGAIVASRLSGNRLLWLLRMTLIVLAARMIWMGASGIWL